MDLICSNIGGTHILDGCSAILVSGSDLLKASNTGEGLTRWMPVGVQPFWSVDVTQICSNIGTHKLNGCSALLVSGLGCDVLKHWRGTHMLDGCSAFLVSGSDPLKHWRETHKLNGCSAIMILVSGSNLLKQRGTHMLDGCSGFLVSGSDPLKH